ncbi:hypothetical protein TVAG_431040 [Trichomonas vaginalis G3]|uniref:Uncharacterized protein n=1 Tax=Trichomonas vaginalis (strain ATCC PRA-98 / G3) TaxID=412133 RepID=A2EZE2_TRIV3|nr:hypothetical protein TVAGG3_0587900 [Trichomonas vaginalis G3]EAY01963.1 hypothetical protein TVAG_431040 [Trichomonas vaginalis G3]KAI5523031.1 hypothetical protein TVAGG3_0587900 [Trichomonas vaginalis G3]|eukprot:XP_001330804.1 hypothetical protein [Trichomonas vaginalis G3]
MEEPHDVFDWTFPMIFKSIETKIKFTHDILRAFEQFPSETKLNCDDFYSIISLVCADVPYNFIVFVCECVDPSISSGTIMSHRIPFGNFLLAFPCCIIYPYFLHELLTLFKTEDTLRRGIINRDRFLDILNQIYTRFFPPAPDPKDKSGKPPEAPQCKLVEESNGNEKRYPMPDIVDEFEKATEELGKSSVQTLLFVMWQKDIILLQCKERLGIPDVQEFQPLYEAKPMDPEEPNESPQETLIRDGEEVSTTEAPPPQDPAQVTEAETIDQQNLRQQGF